MPKSEDEECDYMSDVFVDARSQKRPGLTWGKNERKFNQEKKRKLTKPIQMKSRKVMEQETRDKGLGTKLDEDNKGFAMLQKMGYKPGEGLGKHKSGRAEPVPITVKLGRTGIGKDSHEKRKREVQEKFRTFMEYKRRKYNENIQMDFRARMSNKFIGQQHEKDLRKSQKVCHQLQSEEGIDEPEFEFFWPVEARIKDGEQEEECEVDAEEEYSVEDKLYLLTKFLRDTYFYCIWCAVKYEDNEDLNQNCPGETSNDHD